MNDAQSSQGQSSNNKSSGEGQSGDAPQNGGPKGSQNEPTNDKRPPQGALRAWISSHKKLSIIAILILAGVFAMASHGTLWGSSNEFEAFIKQKIRERETGKGRWHGVINISKEAEAYFFACDDIETCITDLGFKEANVEKTLYARRLKENNAKALRYFSRLYLPYSKRLLFLFASWDAEITWITEPMEGEPRIEMWLRFESL